MPIEVQFYNYELVKVTVSHKPSSKKVKFYVHLKMTVLTSCQVDRVRRDIQFLDKRDRYQEIIMDHFYVTLPSDSSGYYFPSNTIADFRTKLATPLELEHSNWEVGIIEISYPKGYKKWCLHNTLRLD